MVIPSNTYFDEPLCTVRVDIYYTVPVLLKMSSWKSGLGFEKCTCRRYCEK